jgi:hypothetical protein
MYPLVKFAVKSNGIPIVNGVNHRAEDYGYGGFSHFARSLPQPRSVRLRRLGI